MPDDIPLSTLADLLAHFRDTLDPEVKADLDQLRALPLENQVEVLFCMQSNLLRAIERLSSMLVPRNSAAVIVHRRPSNRKRRPDA